MRIFNEKVFIFYILILSILRLLIMKIHYGGILSIMNIYINREIFLMLDILSVCEKKYRK